MDDQSEATIYTSGNSDDTQMFCRLKRKTSGDWTFLISGEWSQSPYHSGKHRFFVRWSESKTYWAVLSTGVPSRIIAVAHTPVPLAVEVIAGKMLSAVRDRDGDYIDMVHDVGKIDEPLFRQHYGKRRRTP